MPPAATRRRVYPWPRFWTRPGRASEQGLFPDPTDTSLFAHPVEAYQLHELTDDRCLVLLGEPGLGKSRAIGDAVVHMQAAGLTVHRVNLGAYDEAASLIGAVVDAPAWRSWTDGADVLYLFLDGLDEALLHVKGFHKRLIELLCEAGDSVDRLRLRISCRAAEWPADFEQALAGVLGEPRVLHLAPLRAADVAAAAEIEGVDAWAFLREIADRDLARFAASPLTLRMLLDDASEDSSLPTTQAELFERAATRLATEHDDARRREQAGTALHAGQRIAVAERIAAAMLLAGRASVSLHPVGGELGVRQLTGYSEMDPDAAGDAHFAVEARDVEQTLGTALFVDLGGGRLGFWHRSLGEYLAARYIVRHEMDAEQAMLLLASADDPEGRLIPQLREVALWAAGADDDILEEVLGREPELVLQAESVELPDDAREAVVESLLHEEPSMRVDRWDRRTRRGFGRLRHPRLADQLRTGMAADRPLAVRQTAIAIAEVAEVAELQPDLLALAFRDAEPPYLRDNAVMALKAYADHETRAELIPLATEHIPDDEDDEIKGQALAATFPGILSVPDVLDALTPARNEYMLGAYKIFVTRTLPAAITRDDLPVALRWAAGLECDHQSTNLLSELADDVLTLAWSHLDDPVIADAVVDIIVPRVVQHSELLGALHDRDDDRTFREAAGRRTLVGRALMRHLGDDFDVRYLTLSDPPLVVEDDLDWVIEQLRAAVGTDAEAKWAQLAVWLFRPEVCDVNEILEIAERSPAFAQEMKAWTAAIPLDSSTARLWRDVAARRRRRDEEAEKAQAAALTLEAMHRQLSAFDEGDLEAWWRLNYDMLGGRRPTRELEADLTRLPGWELADEPTRTRIVDAAGRYLREGDPGNVDDWLKRDTLHRPACGGYRALYLLAKLRPRELEALDRGVWPRWMPIVVSYPRSSGVDDQRFDDAIVEQAAREAPESLAQWAVRVIDLENAKGEGHLFVMWRLRHVVADEVVQGLAAKLDDLELKPQALADLTDYGMRGAVDAFREPVARRLADDTAPDAAVAVGAAALTRAPAVSWPLVWPLLNRRPDLGERIFGRIASGERVDVAAHLDDDNLDALVTWMYERYPPEEDPSHVAGPSGVSPREELAHMRERAAAVLAARGTDIAVAAVSRLEARFGGVGLRRRLMEAREARLARWTAPQPGDVIRLAQSSDTRIVLNDEHLLLAVLGSLRRIQRRLQDSAPPAVRELWNTGRAPRPKHEEELSTWLRHRLDEDLRVGGRIIGRELEIRPNPSGKGRGESTDILIAAPLGDRVAGATTASVIVEVKGCWNRRLHTDMQEQLRDRYLTGTGVRRGIYVVFLFAAEEWDGRDWRRRECRGMYVDELAQKLHEQAQHLSTAAVDVRAAVVDASLPPGSGPARRSRRLLRALLGHGASE